LSSTKSKILAHFDSWLIIVEKIKIDWCDLNVHLFVHSFIRVCVLTLKAELR
jgi:hypothetical protein